MNKNSNLHQAKKNKNDEFYTQLTDIEKELVHYVDFFEGKTVYCNCDDYRLSNFVKYFKDNFHTLKLARLIASNKDNGTGAYQYDYNGTEEKITALQGDGDFRSDECIEFLKEADVVVTNPPFSLFREYVKQLMEYEKKFLIIGNINAITFKEIFPLIKDNKLWLGITKVYEFIQPDASIKKFGNIYWYTNIEHKKHHEPITLCKQYSDKLYPKYDNYDAINVDKVSDIPIDYDGVMGVPITFIEKYCPEQFEIVSFRKGEDGKDLVLTRERESSTVLSYPCSTSIPGMMKNAEGKINGKITYARITIQKKKIKEPIDYFYPPSMIFSGLMNNPKDTIIQGISKYARILIKRKL